MHSDGFVVFAIAMAGVVLLGIWWSWRRSDSAQRASLLDYLLLWPLIFRAERQSKKPTRLAFVVFGILLGVALIAGDMLVNGHRKG